MDSYHALAYGAEMSEGELSSFKNALIYIGFDLRFKPVKQFYNKDEGRSVRKANWDVGMAVDIIQLIDSFDVLILGCADGDMVPCVKYVQERGKLCHVLASKISTELRANCDNYAEIDESFLES